MHSTCSASEYSGLDTALSLGIEAGFIPTIETLSKNMTAICYSAESTFMDDSESDPHLQLHSEEHTMSLFELDGKQHVGLVQKLGEQTFDACIVRYGSSW